ncbi:MAG: HIT domain-containing protein [Nanoarchaeota archaeon]|nr:HIT domain-containing protein [Nanoarchaeota archaeon]
MADPTPEDLKKAEELKKKLESMTPEQLREFQKKNCIFCQIASGKVNAKKIYEDEAVIGILDINPANPGHVLLLPKEHHMILPQLPDDLRERIFIAAKKISNDLLKALDARGTNIVVANGPAAGQRAQHFTVHIIPRKEGDGLKFALPEIKMSEMERLETASAVGGRLNELLGIKKEEQEEKPKKKSQPASETPKSPPKKEPRKSGKVDLDDILKVLHG